MLSFQLPLFLSFNYSCFVPIVAVLRDKEVLPKCFSMLCIPKVGGGDRKPPDLHTSLTPHKTLSAFCSPSSPPSTKEPKRVLPTAQISSCGVGRDNKLRKLDVSDDCSPLLPPSPWPFLFVCLTRPAWQGEISSLGPRSLPFVYAGVEAESCGILELFGWFWW